MWDAMKSFQVVFWLRLGADAGAFLEEFRAAGFKQATIVHTLENAGPNILRLSPQNLSRTVDCATSPNPSAIRLHQSFFEVQLI